MMRQNSGNSRGHGACRSRPGIFGRMVSWILIFAVTAPLYGTGLTVSAENGLCPHHPEHTQECGYTPPDEGAPCGHEHDESCGYAEDGERSGCTHEHSADCGYTEPSEGSDCTHEHDENCGYAEPAEGSDCTHEHDDACGYDEQTKEGCTHEHDGACGYAEPVEGSDCTHEHDENCGYTEPAEGGGCTHEHDGNCGYTASGEGSGCTHEHDEECGYREPSEGMPCTYVCEICAAGTDADEKTDSLPGDGKVRTVVSWTWNGEDSMLIRQEETGSWGLGLPGADAEHPVTRELLLELLPQEITAVLEDGTEDVLALTWSLGGLPEAGAWEGSYTLTAELPEGYAPGEETEKLTVLLELGGGAPYADIDKYVSNWSYASRDGSVIPETDYKYSMNCSLDVTSDSATLIQKLKDTLPGRILCSGYNTNHQLTDAGLTYADGQSDSTGLVRGYVNIEWNTEEVIKAAGALQNGRELTFEARPVSNTGYRIRVNSNNTSLPENANDTAEISGILNMTVTVYDVRPGDRFVSDWKYVSRGGSEIEEDQNDYRYSMDYYMAITSDRDMLARKLSSILPDRISCSGYYSQELKDAGFTPAEGQPTSGIVYGYVNIAWNIDEVTAAVDTVEDGLELTLKAAPVSNAGYRIRVNSRDLSLPDIANDTAEIDNILNLTITLYEINLEDHIVSSVNPPNTTVNLFDYWVDANGAEGNDLLGTTDIHNGPVNPDVPRSGVEDWDKGINKGRLLLFGDGNIHAGYWNKGAGAVSEYGKQAAGMTGLVESVLKDGYPVMDTEAMVRQMDGCEDITDYKLCGDHIGDPLDERYDSTDLQNISKTVIRKWEAEHGGDASLNYLFDPETAQDHRESFTDVEGLFQIDNNGYYYYDMRQNFAEFDEASNRFVLYDAPAVERTDRSYENGGFTGGRSTGNFFPFNTGAEVFDLVGDDGKLSGNENISSHNGRTTAGYMNHHLGMTVSIDFRQTPGGRINMGAMGDQPMTFQFSGDDDVWIFIDDVLVLDLGGIHSEIYGTIDFSTGRVSVGQSWKTNGFPYKDDGTVDLDKLYETAVQSQETTLKAQFEKAGLAGGFFWNGDTFASNTGHTLKMFYLERGNYDSSLALRFNLQPFFYQQIKKVDQDGMPLSGITFDLCPAELTSAEAPGAIQCRYTDNDVNDGNEFWVKRREGEALVHLETEADGSARFVDENGSYFNFADRGRQYYILKETNTPEGYRALPIDIVLYFDPDTQMLSVANRWTTGAYACSVAHIIGTGRLTYGQFNEQTGDIEPNLMLPVDREKQSDGLIVVIPMMLRQSDHTWQALYGSNLKGFQASEVAAGAGVEAWRSAVLRAILEQAADHEVPDWYFSWEEDNFRLTGVFDDLPGLANRYRSVHADGDLRLVYGSIEPAALAQLGISGSSAEERYRALGDYVRAHGTEDTLNAIMSVTTDHTGSGRGFSFLNADQFNQNFRSLIYIPNDQRELWVMKIDQNGRPRNGARFGLFEQADCTGDPVAEGITGTVNGQEGTLIFSSSDDVSPGHAKARWDTAKRRQYYLKELAAPDGCSLNATVIPVVIGTRSIYADAGTEEDGVTVMAGVGKLTQTMHQYAIEDDVDITLRDITATAQQQPSENKELLSGDWKDMELAASSVKRTMNLHYGINTIIDYGLHDEDGGAVYKPFFVADTGYIRARIRQNYEALTTPVYGNASSDANRENLGDTDLTNLFSLLNIVVVTDRTAQETDTGSLEIEKMLSGPDLEEADYKKNFAFTVQFTDPEGQELPGEYFFYGTNKAGYISSGMELPLHHDESITILGLPAGTDFRVTEAEAADWYVFPKSGTVEGEIYKDDSVPAAFKNSREPWPEESFLRIQKSVAGIGDRTKEFTFTVTFTGADGSAVEGTFPYTGAREGSISSGESVTLHDGQFVEIAGLPVNMQYAVAEREADQDGYTTAVHGGTGTTADGELKTASFVNTLEPEKPPGPGPGTDPDPGPGKDPGTDPGTDPKPGTDPGPDPQPGTEHSPGSSHSSRSDASKDSASPEEPASQEEHVEDQNAPSTGDNIHPMTFLVITVLSGLGIAVLVFRKKYKV